jgi:hypothetical protein
MRKIVLPFTMLSAALVCLLPAALAQAAGAARTFVSAAGSDSNNCTNVASPCRHLAAAYAATAANGEIYVLDPANYGSLTISGPVSIEGHGWASIAPPPGQFNAAITITANVGDEINIIGVVLDGTGLSGTTGIQFIGGGSLNVRDSVIRNFGTNGIQFAAGSSGQSHIWVSNTLVSKNGSNGISVSPNAGGIVDGVLDHVAMENNAGDGLYLVNFGFPVNINVNDSVIATNGTGILADDNGVGGPIYVAVRRSDISNNGTGVQANGSGIIRLTQSVITGNATGWTTFDGGSVGSSGDNLIDDNPAGNGVPPGPLYK